MKVTGIAIVCHEANRVWCVVNGDFSEKVWESAEQWQRDSALKGVEFVLANLDASDNAQHDAWMADKIADGWTYGPVKDAIVKMHPYLVPFDQLPLYQQTKDRLFK